MGLKLAGLSVTLERQPLFPPVNLEVPAGTLVTVMGPSGCGKSTLLSVLVGDLDPAFRYQGEVWLNGVRVTGRPVTDRHIGLLYQDDLLFPHMNVGQNLGFGLPPGLSRTVRRERVRDYLERAGLAGFEMRDVAELSGGQRARVSLLRTLLAEPRAVLLDEPFSRLDSRLRRRFRDWVFATLAEQGVPGLLVTHDRADAGQGPVYDILEGRLL